MREIRVAPPLDHAWVPLPLDGIIPNHGPRDTNRLARLRKSMTAKGWMGFPVMVEAHAWNASHRLAMARELGFQTVPAIMVPHDYFQRAAPSRLDPRDAWARLEYARDAYGDTHPITTALRIERGEHGGIEDFYELAGI